MADFAVLRVEDQLKTTKNQQKLIIIEKLKENHK